MKTLLFCTSYISDDLADHAEKRYLRWLKFYQDKMELLGVDSLFLIDDGSARLLQQEDLAIIDAENMPKELGAKLVMAHFQQRLGRKSSKEYPGWWRSFTFSLSLAEHFGYEKIIHIESDFFVTGRRLFSYIKELQSGWTAFYSEAHGFPETAMQVICKDSFELLKEIRTEVQSNQYHIKKYAENYLPFTRVEKRFCGDRIAEKKILKKWQKKHKEGVFIDYIGQIYPQTKFSDLGPMFSFDFSD